MKKIQHLCLILPLIYLLIGKVTTLSAQNPADLFADSMMLTTEGLLIYDSYMEGPFDEATDSTASAYHLTKYYYKHMYYDIMGYFNILPEESLCYNRHFTLSEPEDDFLEGWHIFDGTRRRLDPSNPHSGITFIPLPQNAVPDNTHTNHGCHFDLNPSNNCEYYETGEPDELNFNSVEIYEGQQDEVLSGLISTLTPQGNRSVRLNNRFLEYHVNTMRRQFIVDTCDQFLHFHMPW